MIQLFDDLTEPPIKSRFYMVRCVRGYWGHLCALGDWPVWGPKHDDARFLDYPWPHYHLNRYFVRENDIFDAVRQPLGEAIRERPMTFPNNNPLSAPELKRRKCLWSEPEPFPANAAASGRWMAMYRHFSGAECKRGKGWVCPHKGFDLGSIAAKDGIITCPLHGIRVNAETGRVI